jgi:hypothetical protein
MQGTRPIPVAASIYGRANGIDALATRTRRGEIPGFSIPPELMEDATGREQNSWTMEWERRRAEHSGSDAIVDYNAQTQLGPLASLLFRHEYIRRTDAETTDTGILHTDNPDPPSGLVLHVQTTTVDRGTRDVYLSIVYSDVPLFNFEKLDDEVIVDQIHSIVSRLNKSYRVADNQIWAGTTQSGAGTVFSNVPGQQSAHLFRGNGGWTRFAELADGFPIR